MFKHVIYIEHFFLNVTSKYSITIIALRTDDVEFEKILDILVFRVLSAEACIHGACLTHQSCSEGSLYQRTTRKSCHACLQNVKQVCLCVGL